jgi:hypothetical protein
VGEEKGLTASLRWPLLTVRWGTGPSIAEGEALAPGPGARTTVLGRTGALDNHTFGGGGHMGLQGAFAEFGRLLAERLSLGALTTEDTIRYTFYLALMSQGGVRHTDVTLEYPHPTLPGAKVDTVISAAPGRESAAIEFKYDRANPGGSNQNHPRRAGKALNDLFRLVKLPAEHAALKYFVYVTDDEMAGYFRNPGNRLHELFALGEGAEYAIVAGSFQGFSHTLTTTIEPLLSECVVTSVFAADLTAKHCLRIFRVYSPAVSTPNRPFRQTRRE